MQNNKFNYNVYIRKKRANKILIFFDLLAPAFCQSRFSTAARCSKRSANILNVKIRGIGTFNGLQCFFKFSSLMHLFQENKTIK